MNCSITTTSCRSFSSRARYPSGVPRVPNGLRLTEHPNHIKRRELAVSLKAWIKIVQKYAKENPVGPLYFGLSSPFPYNKEFQNVIPISDNMKNLVYQTYKSGPQYWTVRRLSRAFFLSIERIEGILRMKRLQEDMVERGLKIDEEYIARMEQAIGVNSSDHVPLSKKLSNPDVHIDIADGEIHSYRIASILQKPSQSLNPFFVKIPEGTKLTPQQAGAILERDVIMARDYFSSQPLEETISTLSPEILRNDPCERSKVPFIIVDIGAYSDPRKRTVLVRETNGDLRQGTDLERLTEAKRIWGHEAPKLLRPKEAYNPSKPRPFLKLQIPNAFFKQFSYVRPADATTEHIDPEQYSKDPSSRTVNGTDSS